MLFEEFYTQTFKNTFRFFYYRGVSFSDIDDLSSECYLHFHSKYQDKLNDHIESKKILSGIAANILKEWQRKTYAHKIIEFDDEISDELRYEFYSPDSFDADFEQKQSKLHEMIKSLNPTVRQVLELKFLQNKSRSEIATILQISQDNVHTYQKRGVKYLKDRLNGGIEQNSKSKEQSGGVEVQYFDAEKTSSSLRDATPLTEGNSSS